MTVTVPDIARGAINELGVDYTQFSNMTTDQQFQTYVVGLATDVASEFADRVDPFDLDVLNIFRACVYEVASRMMRRFYNQFNVQLLSNEALEIGPIKITPMGNSATATGAKAAADTYHRQAEAALGAAGGAGRKGAIRNWTPSTRITVA